MKQSVQDCQLDYIPLTVSSRQFYCPDLAFSVRARLLVLNYFFLHQKHFLFTFINFLHRFELFTFLRYSPDTNLYHLHKRTVEG